MRKFETTIFGHVEEGAKPYVDLQIAQLLGIDSVACEDSHQLTNFFGSDARHTLHDDVGCNLLHQMNPQPAVAENTPLVTIQPASHIALINRRGAHAPALLEQGRQ